MQFKKEVFELQYDQIAHKVGFLNKEIYILRSYLRLLRALEGEKKF